uniref:O-methyltransferase n=1 Tax=Plectus sambesii TaxID=2011161 RepID=A0A914X8Z6_9BILA
MNEKIINPTWSAVDGYIVEQLLPKDAVLDAVLEANKAGGLPAIDVSPTQGKLLHMFAKMVGARRILEIGTLGGYSTIWMARALPEDGRLITLECEPHHAEVAKANIASAGLEAVVDIRVGAALDILPKLAAEANTQSQPFDLIFIDADKPNNANYLEWAMKLSRPGTVIVCDNVIRNGAVIDGETSDAKVHGSRAAFEFQGSHPKLTATALQTVGSKGYDGFTIAIVE